MTTAVISDYLEAKLLNFMLRNEDFSAPASVYLGLFTAAPSDAGGGTEVSGGSYARYELTGGFDAPASRHTQNTSLITFPTATADWGEVTHIGIFDALSGGNLLFWGAYTVSQNILSGKTETIPAGNLDVSITGYMSTYLANELLDHVLNGATFTKPTDAYLALYTTAPDIDDAGATEVSGGSYARISVWGSSDWDAPTATGGDTENTNVEAFAAATANWGEVVAVAIRSAITAGNLWWVKALVTPRTVNSGDTFRFSAGALDLTIA